MRCGVRVARGWCCSRFGSFEEMAIAASATLLRPYGVACVVAVRPRYIWWPASTDSVAEALVPTGQSR